MDKCAHNGHTTDCKDRHSTPRVGATVASAPGGMAGRNARAILAQEHTRMVRRMLAEVDATGDKVENRSALEVIPRKIGSLRPIRVVKITDGKGMDTGQGTTRWVRVEIDATSTYSAAPKVTIIAGKKVKALYTDTFGRKHIVYAKPKRKINEVIL